MSSVAQREVFAAEDRSNTLGAQEITEVTSRLLHSETFRRCTRLRDFLCFMVDCSLQERVHEINEYSLGVQVFGKSADYALSQDTPLRARWNLGASKPERGLCSPLAPNDQSCGGERGTGAGTTGD